MFRNGLLAVVGILSLTLHGAAAPVPKDDSGPQITLKVQSANELARRAKEFLKAAVPAAAFDSLLQSMGNLDTNLIPLIDPSKPAGLVVTLNPAILQGDWKGTRIVAIVPVKGEEDAIQTLKKQGITLEKQGDVYSLARGPITPVNLFVRFKERYAHVGIGTEDSIAEHTLVDPVRWFAEQDTALATLAIRLDRLPRELKELAAPLLAAAPLMMGPFPEMLKPFEKARNEVFNLLSRRTKLLTTEGRELALRLDLSPKGGTVDFEVTVDGVPRTSLDEEIRAYQRPENRFGSLITSDAAAYLVTKFPIHAPELRRGSGETVREFGGRLSKLANTEAKPLIDAITDSLAQTMESGNADLVVVLNGPSKEGPFQLIGAMQLQKVKEVEKTFGDVMKKMVKEGKAPMKWDTTTIGKASVYEMDLKDQVDEFTKKMFGTKPKISLAFTEESLIVAFGSDNTPAVRNALNAKKTRQPVFALTAFPRKFDALIKAQGVAQNAGWGEMLFMAHDSVTPLRIDIEGGEKVKVKISSGMMLVALLGMQTRTTFEQVGQPIAPPVQKK